MTQKLVRDVMHKGVITCPPRRPLKDVARIMIKNDIREVVVRDHGTFEICGVISDWLLIQAHGTDLNKIVAEDILLPYTVTISPQATLTEAIELMRKKRIRSLIVVDGGGDGVSVQPIGIVSCYDIIKEMAELELVFPHYRRW